MAALVSLTYEELEEKKAEIEEEVGQRSPFSSVKALGTVPSISSARLAVQLKRVEEDVARYRHVIAHPR